MSDKKCVGQCGVCTGACKQENELNPETLKENFAIAKSTLEAVLCFIIPDNCRTMVETALKEINK